MSSYVFAAGGTGGHVFPAVTVAEQLRLEEPEAEILFVGTGAKVELEIVKNAGFAHHTISFVPLRGKGLFGALRMLSVFPKSIYQCLKLYQEIKPQVVMGFGGFPSLIPALTAALTGRTLVVHEQNGETGLANRLLSLFARRVYSAPGVTDFYRKSRLRHLMNPVRAAFYQVPKWSSPEEYSRNFSLLVVGGSQGAVSLNDAIISLYPFLASASVEVIHQAGPKDCARVKEEIDKVQGLKGEAQEFIQDMAGAYARADLVICRAGAMTAAEVTASGRAAFFVPLPLAGGHQEKNVRHLVEASAAKLFHHGPGLVDELRRGILEAITDYSLIERLAENASQISRGDSLNCLPVREIVKELRGFSRDLVLEE